MTEATTYEGRRQMDKVAAKAAAASAAQDTRLKAAQADLAIEEAREKAADRKRQRAEAAKTKALEEKQRRAEKKAAARKARNERLAAVIGNPLPWVLTVVVASVATAWPGQYHAMIGMGTGILAALLVPVFIEGSTWSMAWLTKWAVENDKPAGTYRMATWIFAAVAAALNASHHLDQPVLAVTMALSSLVGVVVWEIYMHSQQHRAGGRSAAEIKLALQRRLRHPRVSRRASWLRTSTIPALSEADAWEMAWRQLRGAEPGVTKRLLERHGKQVEKVAVLVEKSAEQRPTASLNLFTAPPEPVREVPAAQGWMIRPEAIERILTDPSLTLRAGTPAAPARKIDNGTEGAPAKAPSGPHAGGSRPANRQVKPNNPPSARGREKGADEGPAKQVRAAREAAAETARAATAEQADAEKTMARAWALEQLRAGREIGWRDVQKHVARETDGTLRGETWCRQRLNEAKADGERERPLHLVAAGTR